MIAAMRPLRAALALCAAALALAACAAPRPRRVPPPPPSPLAKAIIRAARRYLPEESAGLSTPRDCSDFVRRVFRARGVRLPRTAAEMSRLGRPVDSTRDLRMADLLFFSGRSGGRRVGHVAIYVNNGIFIHEANPGEGVRLESLYSDYYRRRYLEARRVVN